MSDSAKIIAKSSKYHEVTNIQGDGLSSILAHLGLSVEIYLHTDLCGEWAMDTSGNRKAAFHLVERGIGWLHTEDGQDPRVLGQGDFVVFPHDAAHCISSAAHPPNRDLLNKIPPQGAGPVTGLLCGYFEFKNRYAWPLLDELPDIIVIDLKDRGQNNNMSLIIQMIVSELGRSPQGLKATLQHLGSLLFVEVLRSQALKELDVGILAALADPHIGAALNVIHTEFHKDWSVESLAHHAGLSRTAFSGKFSSIVGKTPVRYLTEWRMQEAVSLLENSNQTMGKIAHDVGYQSEVAFRKAFKKVTGRTPASHRKKRTFLSPFI